MNFFLSAQFGFVTVMGTSGTGGFSDYRQVKPWKKRDISGKVYSSQHENDKGRLPRRMRIVDHKPPRAVCLTTNNLCAEATLRCPAFPDCRAFNAPIAV